ncbi:MAG: hypothetical protein KKF46_02055 [Nanoarchaeota archaeon]|nr:hypothetical protein [Nanoarchaeota archaeon]MBU1321117.1 hypothetical protein [Nanoarchaeota archaeon]MBU1598409.1 hypothetical protein [Nanoarchaeota archaeon]MBU2440874.1 hypothetical protein [Nanoarchaeota archaeon]
MDFEEFKKTSLYEIFAKPMKVQSAIYFLQKEKGGAPFPLLEKNLENDVSRGELEISINFWIELKEVDYDFAIISGSEEHIYSLTPKSYEGLENLIGLVEEASERKKNEYKGTE